MWGSTLWIEPLWKMMWSNKALLALLWELNPGHELLLPAYLDGPRDMRDYVRKPLFGREGQGIAVVRDGVAVEGSLAGFPPMRDKAAHGWGTQDTGDRQRFVYQAIASMAEAAGNTAVLGSWLIDGEPAGMGIRESRGLVTNNTSRFVPHLFQ
jgi:glutathionylspermidine synthase